MVGFEPGCRCIDYVTHTAVLSTLKKYPLFTTLSSFFVNEYVEYFAKQLFFSYSHGPPKLIFPYPFSANFRTLMYSPKGVGARWDGGWPGL